jgi:hypothetical protein
MGYVPILLLLAALALPARADPLDPTSFASLGTLDLSSGSVTFNTDTLEVSGAFSATGVLHVQGTGLPDVAVFAFSGINLPSGVAVNVTGARPIALLSQGNATIDSVSVVPVANSTGKAGGGNGGSPPVARNGQGPGGGIGTASDSIGAGGGGFGGVGGNGGGGANVSVGGLAGPAYGNLGAGLQAGSGGGAGFRTAGGAGGGGIEIGAVGTLTVGNVNATGGSGQNAPTVSDAGGGGGGGSGGAILLHAAIVTPIASLVASGGRGGRGADGTFIVDTHGGGGGGGGRVLVMQDAFTLGSAVPIADVAGGAGGFPGGGALTQPGQNGAAGVAELMPQLTIMPSGFARQLGSDGTFVEVAGNFRLQTTDLQVNGGAVAFAAAPVANAQSLYLQGGLVSAGLGWTATDTAQISGFGQLAGSFSGGAGNSVSASDGALAIGDLNHSAGFSFAGATTVAAGATLLIQDADSAQLGHTTTLGAGGRLVSVNGVTLGSSQTLSASGAASIDGNFANQGTVHGPGGTAQLVFLDDVSGGGSYTGNITFSDGFAPGNSPGSVHFAGNATYDASSLIEMELGALAHDHIAVDGLLKLGGGALEVDYYGSFSPGAGARFDLFDWGTLEGAFGAITLPELADGLAWHTGNLYADGSISVVAIPEPQTYALLLAGLGLLGFAARRRRKW